ncbi:hypothetical protein TNCV_5136891 [Trichonephila clavipes]|nr:hypothetical protein TNCV_5136891 [Trichonephila clavipes]
MQITNCEVRLRRLSRNKYRYRLKECLDKSIEVLFGKDRERKNETTFADSKKKETDIWSVSAEHVRNEYASVHVSVCGAVTGKKGYRRLLCSYFSLIFDVFLAKYEHNLKESDEMSIHGHTADKMRWRIDWRYAHRKRSWIVTASQISP